MKNIILILDISNETWRRCGSLGFQTAAEEPVCATECWCVVDDVRVGVWEVIFYLLSRVFSLFLKSDGDWVDVTSCVESAEGFVL